MIIMANIPLHGRIRAYEKRHPGRDPFCDAFAGLLWAVPEALERWLHECAVPACRGALRGRACAPFPALPSWLGGILLMHLDAKNRNVIDVFADLGNDRHAKADLAPSFSFWGNEQLLNSLVSPEPLSWLVELLNSHVELGQWQRGEENVALARVVDSILHTTLRLDGSSDVGEASAPASMTLPLLEYSRDMVVGMGGVEKHTTSRAANEDTVTRRFTEGILTWFKHESLGLPSVADFTLLSLISGLECDDPETVRNRWKTRYRLYGVRSVEFSEGGSYR